MDENSVDINRELLSAYLDGELGEADNARVELLLKVSESAQQELAEMVQVRQLFSAWSSPGPDRFFVRRVDHLIEQEATQMQREDTRRWTVQKLATAAMLLICVGAVAFLGQRLDRQTEPVTLDSFLQGSLDSEVPEAATLADDDLSNDRVLDLVFTSNTR